MFFSKIGYKQLDRVILGLELKTGTSLGHFPVNITSAHVQFIGENLLCRHVILFSTLMHFLIQSEIIWAVSHHVMFTSANNATVFSAGTPARWHTLQTTTEYFPIDGDRYESLLPSRMIPR